MSVTWNNFFCVGW